MGTNFSTYSPDRIYQYSGAIEMIGPETLRFAKKSLLVVDLVGWEKVKAQIEDSLVLAGVEAQIYKFSGYCSEQNVNRIIDKAISFGAGVIVGIGGGKVIDTSKSVADKMGIRVITIPTCAATCAAYVQLCVWYDDYGRCRPGMTIRDAVAVMIIDTKLLLENCPSRFFAAGIADALAKFPELDYNVNLYPLPNCTENFYVSSQIGRRCFDFLLENGYKAVKDVTNGIHSQVADNVLQSIISMTGLASALVAGVKQLAVAHMFYNAVAIYFREQRDKYLHGEIVSCGIRLQLEVNGYPAEFVNKVVGFLHNIGTPTCLSEIGIQPTPENKRIILDHLQQNGFDTPEVFEKILTAFESIYR